jgi:hypothetical protein
VPTTASLLLLTAALLLIVAQLLLTRRMNRLIHRLTHAQSRSHRLHLDYAINVTVNAQAELTSLIMLDRPLPGVVADDVVCSLTTVADRLAVAHYAIESLLLQSVRPASVELYLSDELSPGDLPESLRRLTSCGLNLHFVPDVGPHTKLIYALDDFSGKAIITADDDLYYPSNTVAALLRTGARFPHAVVGNWARRLSVDARGLVNPVRTGELLTPPVLLENVEQERHDATPSFDTFVYGTGGILYPAKSLDRQAADVETFRRLCPTEDDVWFKAMALLQGTPAVPTNLGIRPSHHVLRGSQGNALRHVNHDPDEPTGGGENARQLRAVFDHFDLHRLLRAP